MHGRRSKLAVATIVAHAPFLCAVATCLLAFAWMVTFGTFHFVADDSFGSFYDHQAAAWLEGRWDVPEPALSGEAMIVDGKIYGYFGPTPALMRLPFVQLGIGFAKLTRLMMLLDYTACLAAAYALLCLAARWRNPAARPSPFATIILCATVGLGSTLYFLGSRAYVYHEAILCGAAFALWSVFASLRYLQAPATRWWIVALAAGVLAVQARAPIGLFALCVLGSCALVCAFMVPRPHPAAATDSGRGPSRSPPDHRLQAGRRPVAPLAVAVLAAAGIASFNLVSYIKFGTYEGCPLRFNVQYDAAKLAVLDHRNFHISNLRFNADAYLLRPSFSVTTRFPYVYREYIDRKKYPESRMAYRDQTLAMPWAMPGLFALGVFGSLLAAAGVPAFRIPITVLWAAAIPAALAMLTAVAVTQRYTADFCPFLIATTTFALAALDGSSRPIVRTARFAAGALSILGIGVTLALTLHHQREIVWGVPDEIRRDYQEFRRRADDFFCDPHAG